MTKIWLLLLLAFVLSAAGCTTQEQPSGDREFIPGQGWVPIKH